MGLDQSHRVPAQITISAKTRLDQSEEVVCNHGDKAPPNVVFASAIQSATARGRATLADDGCVSRYRAKKYFCRRDARTGPPPVSGQTGVSLNRSIDCVGMTSGCSMTLLKRRSKSSRSSRKPRRKHGSTSKARSQTMPRSLALAEVKDDLSKYLRLAAEQEIVITRHGRSADILIGFAERRSSACSD